MNPLELNEDLVKPSASPLALPKPEREEDPASALSLSLGLMENPVTPCFSEIMRPFWTNLQKAICVMAREVVTDPLEWRLRFEPPHIPTLDESSKRTLLLMKEASDLLTDRADPKHGLSKEESKFLWDAIAFTALVECDPCLLLDADSAEMVRIKSAAFKYSVH